jgi:NAD(P)-dependent dehydrogenase (short-subunit alcohol dehydrogenase family)
MTDEGIEESFAVTFLSRFIITEKLLPEVMKSTEKLIIAIASPGQGPGVKAKINFDDINFEKGKFSTMKTVGQFQHANEVYFTHILEKNRDEGLRCYLYNPGVVDTGIHKNWPFIMRLLMTTIMRPMMISPKQSAEIPLNLISGIFKPDSSMFNFKSRTIQPSTAVTNTEYGKRFTDFCQQMIYEIERKSGLK